MRGDGPVFLRHAGHVQHRHALAFQVRGHAQQGPDGDDPSAAYAGDQHVVAAIHGRCCRHGQGLLGCLLCHWSALAQTRPFDRDKARTKAFVAAVVFVARGLVNQAFAAEFGVQRKNRGAIALLAAIAAAFAHQRVYEKALIRFSQALFFAHASFFSGADLVVNQHCGAGQFPQFALHAFHVGAVVHRHPFGQTAAVGVALHVFGHHHHTLHAFGGNLAGHGLHRQLSVHRLTAGHGHGAVVENFVSDIDFGRDGRAYGQRAGVKVGAVAEVGEHVVAFGEMRLPYPRRTFAAHVGGGFVVLGVDGGGHHMAADTGQRQTALRHLGGGVVRATGAVIRRAHRRVDSAAQHRFFGIQKTQALLYQLAGVKTRNPRGNHAGDLRHREIRLAGQQPFAARRHPFAFDIELADDARAHIVAPVVQLLFELVFNDLAFLFHHQNFVQAGGEFAHTFGLQRPGHGNLEQAYAQLRRIGLVNPQLVQRFHHVQVTFARSDDAQACIRRVYGGVVESVLACIRQRRVNFVVLHQRFLLARLHAQRVAGQTAVEPAGRHDKVRR